MARRRYRRNEGLFEIAARSDWRVAAGLAATCALGAGALIPGLAAQNPLLGPVAAVFAPLGWLFAFAFACIAAVRFAKQRTAAPALAPDSRVATRPRRSSPGRPTARGHDVDTSPSDSGPAQSPAAGPAGPERPDHWSLDVLEQIDWKRFEDLCCEFYRVKGIRAETTPLGADGGIDVRLFQDSTEPDQVTAIVQCKALSKQVGVKLVRELRGVMAHEKVQKAFFMAPSGFTEDARAFATENRITLLDGKLFLAMLQRLPEEAGRRLLEFATEGDWTTPSCPSCGTKMAAREGQRGPFWGCSTFPRCRGKLQMRTST